jgi:hypothetical protein
MELAMNYRNVFILLTIVLLWTISCGSSGGSSKASLNDANTQFTTGSILTARETFISLIASEGSAARIGAGWCDLRLKDYAQADSFFAASAADSLPDGYAGWSFTAWYNNNPQQVVDRVNLVLTKSPSYTFSLDTRITKNSLLYVRAGSYLQLTNYAACLADIKVIDSSYGYTLTGNAANDGAALLQKLTSLGAAV